MSIKGRKNSDFGKIGAIFQVDDLDFGIEGGGFGLLVEGNEGMMGFCEVIVDNTWSGGTFDAGNVEGFSDEASEAWSGIMRGVFLVVGAFVGLVDDD